MPPRNDTTQPKSVPYPQQKVAPVAVPVRTGPPVAGILIAFAAGAALGAAVTYGFGGGIGTTYKYQSGFLAGQEAARAELQGRLVDEGYVTDEAELLSLSGRVLSANASQIVIDAPVRSANPLNQAPPAERTVRITANTVVRFARQKDAATFRAETVAYSAAMEAWVAQGAVDGGPAAPVRPERVSYETRTAADIKANDLVTVEAAQDIRAAASFDATVITVNGNTNDEPPGTTEVPVTEEEPATE